MNDRRKEMWKEVNEALYKVLPRHLLEGTEEHCEIAPLLN